MELNVIRHKNSADYFRGFYPVEQADAYAYQLQRMFESGAAKEGDYFLVSEGREPYFQVEIYRNNTRRIWEKAPLYSMSAVPSYEKNIEALKLIFEFLAQDDFYPRHEERLEIVIFEDSPFTALMTDMSSKYGFKKFQKVKEFTLTDFSLKNITVPDNITIEPFIVLEPEERFDLVHDYDITAQIFENSDPEKLYSDYIEDAYESEVLWKIMRKNGLIAGIIMPAFTTGFKNYVRLNNYKIADKNSAKDVSLAMINILSGVALEYHVKKTVVPVDLNDEEFIEELTGLGAKDSSSYSRWSRK
jgi:hypothetical protein